MCRSGRLSNYFFEEYGTRLEPPDELSEGTEIDAMSTQSLSDQTILLIKWHFSGDFPSH